jgi:hypothetical protein
VEAHETSTHESSTSSHPRQDSINSQRFRRPLRTATPMVVLGAGVSAAPIAAPTMKALPAQASKRLHRYGLPTCLTLKKTALF